MKLNYSEPKIYTGGVDISKWSSLSKSEQKSALSKKWYLYYSYRDPKTKKLRRQPNIKGDANKLSTKTGRTKYLKTLQRSLTLLLEAGFNPHKDNSDLEKQFLTTDFSLQDIKSTYKKKSIPLEAEEELQSDKVSISEAFDLGLITKEKVLNKTSYKSFKSRINRFRKWLAKNDIKENDAIKKITKKTVIQYLNSVLQSTSPRNRNNTRTDLSSLFQTLEDNDIIHENFVKKLNVLSANPRRNKTYTPKLQKDIYCYLQENDPILFLFVQFISYNFLRPIEVCRLKIRDLDVQDKKLYVRAKNRLVKIKIIPDILIKQMPDISQKTINHFFFTRDKIGGEWDIDENNKRDYFTKRFKKVKDHFNLGKEYGLYSFRHTFITKLYIELRKSKTPFEAKSALKLITGHSTMQALEQYLRDIDAELPEDYSDLLI